VRRRSPPVEPTRFCQEHGQRQRLLAGRTGHAPDLQRRGTATNELRHDNLDQGTQLIDLAPEVRFVDGKRVHHLRPLVTFVGIFQEVVVVHERPEAARHDQRCQPIRQLVELVCLIEQPQPLMNQVTKDLGDAA